MRLTNALTNQISYASGLFAAFEQPSADQFESCSPERCMYPNARNQYEAEIVSSRPHSKAKEPHALGSSSHYSEAKASADAVTYMAY